MELSEEAEETLAQLDGEFERVQQALDSDLQPV